MEIKNSRVDLQRLVRLIAARFSQDRCAHMAASLTFTTLLSLVPLVTIALTMFSAFPVFADFSDLIKKFVTENMLPETGGKLISSYLEQFAESAARLTVLGFAFLGVTAMLMMLTIDHALNTIWHVSRPRTLMQRVLIYWLVLTLGPLLVGGSLSLTTWLVGISVGYATQLTGVGLAALKVTPLMLTAPAFIFLFRVVPNRYVPMRHAVIGGLVSAVAFESMNSFFALYIAHFPTYKLVYGAFASIPVFLLWIYLSWITVLLGAVVASSLSHWRSTDGQQPDPMAQLYYALCMLRMMSKGLRSGRVQTLPIFCEKLHVGFDFLEQILAKLARANLVSKLAGQGWSMVRDPELVKLGELHHLFVFDPESIVVRHEDGGIGEWLRREGQQGMGASDMSLRELFDRASSGLSENPEEKNDLFTVQSLDSQ
ncbi:MAG TPA: YihY family inner membrane protein [Gallionellaceae bacterium]|nr:YihY family inner membrane protein [Gallionellaceae bacterium]